jgi:RND superfamily putative drug exporter
LRDLRKLSTALAADPRTAQVASLSTMLSALPDDRFASISRDFFATTPGQPNGAPAAIASRFVNLDGAADTTTLTVLPKHYVWSDETLGFIRDLRTQILPGFGLNGDHVAVGGLGAGFIDFSDALYGRFPVVAIALAALIFVLLMVFFRSILLPIKAAVLSALVLVATNGVLVWLFQDGHGESLLGFHSQGRVSVVTPVIIFVILFGLSADYEVFMLSRVREYYLETRDTVQSVALGLQHTAGIITAAGLILVTTFGSLAASNLETMKELGVGLAIGVLIDATLVRTIMVPATMRLAQKVNWWIPAWLARLLPAVGHESNATFEGDRTDGQHADDRVDVTV